MENLKNLKTVLEENNIELNDMQNDVARDVSGLCYVEGKYYPETRWEPAEYPEIIVDLESFYDECVKAIQDLDSSLTREEILEELWDEDEATEKIQDIYIDAKLSEEHEPDYYWRED